MNPLSALKMFQLFLFVTLLSRIKEIECMAPYQLNMYYTDTNMFNAMGDGYCLYYHSSILVHTEYSVQHHLYPYCFRSPDDLEIESNSVHSSITFSQLRERRITAEQLYLWSAPMDVIERYQMYLINTSVDNSTTDSQRFYNCTWPLFGPGCQFYFNIKHSSFQELLLNAMRLPFGLTDSGVLQLQRPSTCYLHPDCDYIYPLPMCLTWRDICDGKVHCLNNGIDEQDCFQLELNQCDNNHEYRCHNGQCIPLEFWQDVASFPDCLDRSDEIIDYSIICFLEPTMRCEDHICQPGRQTINCGDGQCDNMDCSNGQVERWEIALISKPKVLPFSSSCWTAINCLARIHLLSKDYECNCGPSDSSCIRNIQANCPSLFLYPLYPVALGFIHYAYRKNQSYVHPTARFALPTYICYKEKYCPTLSSSTRFPSPVFLSINSSDSPFTCHELSSLSIMNNKKIVVWQQLQRVVENIYSSACLKYDQIHANLTNNCQSYPQLYACENSLKCISKFRVMDGIDDCPMGDDERYLDSCSLTNLHPQYRCTINGTSKCVSPILFYNNEYECEKQLPVYESLKPKSAENSIISFQTLCDGFEERHPSSINNETDETNCNYQIWPCNNTYTHCDGYWNCANGLDELRCPSVFDFDPQKPLCGKFEHICISPVDYKLKCVHISEVNDNVVDCLGGTDERRHCRSKYHDPAVRYRCLNDDSCVDPEYLCDHDKHCHWGDDEDICWIAHGLDPKFDLLYHHLCTEAAIKSKLYANILCQLDEIGKPNVVHFSLKSFSFYPKPSYISRTTLINNRQLESVVAPSAIQGFWIDDDFGQYRRFCHRSLPIHIRPRFNHSFQENCLCSPAYYGSRCQYENERIALTLRFRVISEWDIPFTFLILLIDNNGIVHSHEKILYLSKKDCSSKFHTYLTYNSRLKNRSETYHIRIHSFVTTTMRYRASWSYPIQHSFLPVHRMALQLNIPRIFSKKVKCIPNCGQHGACYRYVNIPTSFCRCHSGWRGQRCQIENPCQCSDDSICVDSPNVCLCSVDKAGSRCYLQRSVCRRGPNNSSSLCFNGGICIPKDIRNHDQKVPFYCICPDGYHGDLCQDKKPSIEFVLKDDVSPLPESFFAHFVAVDNQNGLSLYTMIGKLRRDQPTVTLYPFDRFNLVFVEFFNEYYLGTIFLEYQRLQHMKLRVGSSQRCSHINQLFNETIIGYHPLRRAKYYHIPCRERLDLRCFHDFDTFMCLCNDEHYADCFNFNFSGKHDCLGNNYCLNDGQCFEDRHLCPTMSVCSCANCFYGTICQFSSETFRLSLESILGYHIQLQLSLFSQSMVVKMSSIIVLCMFFVGFVNGVLSIVTFGFTPSIRKIGCGIYLLTSSIINLFTIHILLIKFLLLFFIQNGTIVQQWILQGSCILTDFFIRALLNMTDWLSACIAIERILTVVMGIKFNNRKSQQVSRCILNTFLCLSLRYPNGLFSS